MNVTSVLEPIIQQDSTAPGDYTGEDGLLYCGKCHTPKQTRGQWKRRRRGQWKRRIAR